MHTIQENWVSDADLKASSESQFLYALFGINYTVFLSSEKIEKILDQLKLNDLPRAAPVAPGFGSSMQRL
jgi:hypothetical protein